MRKNPVGNLKRRQLLGGVTAAAGLTFLTPHKGISQAQTLKTVRFGFLPYADHTQGIIGVEKGFFRDVGLDVKYDTIKVEQAVPFLHGGRYDIVSVAPGLLLAGFNEAPNLQMFVYGSLFQGYAVMAQSSLQAKSYQDFVAAGATPTDAVKQVIQQLKGRTFAYPPEGGIKPFVDLLLQVGGLGPSDFRPLVVDDPIGVAAMRRGDADFQVGGAPARILLQRAGFKPIISAVDLARTAAPSKAL